MRGNNGKIVRGMTLVEMMMAIFIMLIAMEGFTLLLLKSFRLGVRKPSRTTLPLFGPPVKLTLCNTCFITGLVTLARWLRTLR
jgi:prepilin-type N-terminal cleavage/methylation domain-containing protein